jgi:FMN phosphatase YigB (HAD superfamily)
MMIHNLLLDLGGVLYNISYQNMFDAFGKLSSVPLKPLVQQLAQNPFFDDVDEGRVSKSELILTMRQLLKMGPEIHDDSIIEAWDKILVGPAPRWQTTLEKLSKKYRLILLSNNNDMHLSSIKASYPSATPYSVLESHFTDLYYSHTIGIRKPKVESFTKTIELAKLNPVETLFIDDTLPNIEAAALTGLKTFHFEHNGSLAQLEFLF